MYMYNIEWSIKASICFARKTIKYWSSLDKPITHESYSISMVYEFKQNKYKLIPCGILLFLEFLSGAGGEKEQGKKHECIALNSGESDETG